jgi:hypothetical protein
MGRSRDGSRPRVQVERVLTISPPTIKPRRNLVRGDGINLSGPNPLGNPKQTIVLSVRVAVARAISEKLAAAKSTLTTTKPSVHGKTPKP